jgi:hypothetical protein
MRWTICTYHGKSIQVAPRGFIALHIGILIFSGVESPSWGHIGRLQGAMGACGHERKEPCAAMPSLSGNEWSLQRASKSSVKSD